ncbi:MAG: AAA family ATPase, partial [Candidatus Riflebacteria bacterium]|nr:AAA family ATPase [Candidatus Riflebacteria bacterium]
MLKKIEILGGPIHAGKSFSFTTGETAIIGPNGCGKSLLAEYMAFALFGTVALRGKVTDYKGLSVRVELVIKGNPYIIERDTKTCKLTSGNEVICLGTKPCNAKIITLLGYDYNVYKMGNYAGQLDILGLGKLKPSERKTALDRTLGIGIIDKLIKYANDIALKNQHESEALKSVLLDPGPEPVPPTCYKEGVRQELFSEYTAINNNIEGYKAFQEMEKPIQPVKPEEPGIRILVSDTPQQFLEKVL